MKMHFFIFSLLVSLVGCASRPQLYPNERLKSVGAEGAQKDIDACLAKADEFLTSSSSNAERGAGSGAAIGAAMGAADGIFTGNAARKAVRGGAVGAAVGGTAGAVSPDQIHQRFVNQCLVDKGYQVIGWN